MPPTQKRSNRKGRATNLQKVSLQHLLLSSGQPANPGSPEKKTVKSVHVDALPESQLTKK